MLTIYKGVVIKAVILESMAALVSALKYGYKCKKNHKLSVHTCQKC